MTNDPAKPVIRHSRKLDRFNATSGTTQSPESYMPKIYVYGMSNPKLRPKVD